MIRAVFARDFSAFSLSGHAGYADAGEDIVCAAVSAMTNLTVNTAEAFGAQAEVIAEEEGTLSYRMLSDCGEARQMLKSFHRELVQLQNLYPAHVRVKLK